MSKKDTQQEKKKSCPVVYSFPLLTDDSIFIAFSGAKVIKAELEYNGGALSVIKPSWPEDEPIPDPIPITDIDFFGGKPIHACLAKNWKLKVVLHVEDKKLPTLVLKPADQTLTWDNTQAPYVEEVTAGSTAGEKKLKLVYYPDSGGYIA